MKYSRQLFDQSLFALLALSLCVLLAFRPIPDTNSSNDTGRYIDEFHSYCSGISGERAAKKETSYNLFFLITSPACLIESDGVFLFEVALFLPMVFLLFSKWRKGTFIFACSVMFGVYGLELMTNALRQGFATLLFFGAVALLERHRYWALLLCFVAILSHVSVAAYFPFFLWISGLQLTKKLRLIVGGLLLLVGMVLFLVFYGPIMEYIQTVRELGERYSLIYSIELKPSFILFMLLPLYWVYGIRHFFEKSSVTNEECKAVVYSTMLFVVCYLLTPYVIFRFAIFAVVLQIFLATRAEHQGIKAANYIFVGLIVHFLVMLVGTDHFMVLLNG